MARRQASWPRPLSGMMGVPQKQNTNAFHLPAPVGGINTVDVASKMDPSDCLYLYNMIPFQYGLRTRSGWHEQATSVGTPVPIPDLYQDSSPMMFKLAGILGGARIGAWTGTGNPGVRSILSFSGSDDRGLQDRLFACTKEGIWDVSKPTSSPVQVYTFEEQNLYSGKGIGTAFTNVAGEHFYAYTDEANGYILYRESTQTWTKIVEGSGIDGVSIKGANPASFRFVMAWKNRLWFATASSATAVYLPVGQFAGVVDNNDVEAGGTINFGSRFRYGGNLVGLWNWTVDGGVGIDDHLVGISSAGDVVIYTGTDPALPGAFGLKGVWWVGPVPPGRKIASQFGGDLFILALIGCVPLSKLVAGYMIRDPNIYATGKIANLFNVFMTERGLYPGWEINMHPTDNLLVIMVPATPGKVQEQLLMSMASKGWSRATGIPMTTMETWRGKLYFGTADSRVCINDGTVDGLTLDNATSWPIDFSLLSSFSNMGSARKKRLHMAKPLFMTDGTVPGYEVQSRWDFDITAVDATPIPADLLETSVWNQGTWDKSKWDDGIDKAGAFYGASGMGTHAAIILKGSAAVTTTLVGFDIAFDQGGIL
jgi:hypothetical protein